MRRWPRPCARPASARWPTERMQCEARRLAGGCQRPAGRRPLRAIQSHARLARVGSPANKDGASSTQPIQLFDLASRQARMAGRPPERGRRQHRQRQHARSTRRRTSRPFESGLLETTGFRMAATQSRPFHRYRQWHRRVKVTETTPDRSDAGVQESGNSCPAWPQELMKERRGQARATS